MTKKPNFLLALAVVFGAALVLNSCFDTIGMLKP